MTTVAGGTKKWPGRAIVVAVIILAGASPVRAGVSVTLDPGPGQQLATALGIDLTQLTSQFEAEAEQAFSLLEPAKYLRAMADAQAFSNKGLGVDYASNPDWFVVGAGASFALTLGELGLEELNADRPVAGMSPNASIMVGGNLGFLGAEFLTLYANFFYMDFQFQQVVAQARNFGLHLQATFYRPEGDPMEALFQWSGVSLTSGYQWSYLGFVLSEQLTTSIPLSGSGQTVDATMVSSGTFEIVNIGNSIPVEVTTGIRFLYVASLYAGAGFDIQLGGSDMRIQLSGDVTAPDPRDGSTLNLGRADITATEAAKPSGARLRLLAGLQLNLWFAKLFFQVNMMPELAVSAATGLRVAL